MTSSNSSVAPALAPTARARTSRKFASLRTISALVLREMSTQYGRTPGGFLWAIFEPLAAILFLSLGFRLVVRSAPLGNSFLLFFATGFMFFSLYLATSNTTAKALKFSKPLLKYPAVNWLDAILARFLLNGLTNTLTMVLLIGGVLLYLQIPIRPDLGAAVLATALALLLGLGVGTLNSAIMGLFPIWDIAWLILNRPLFLASGVFFTYDSLPPAGQQILWFNPIIHIVGLARSSFYPTYNPSYVSILYVTLYGLVTLVLGLILMRRYHREILNR